MRILLAEHHSQVLKALQILLKEKTEYTLVGEATDADSLLDQVEKTCPDLVVFDWELPGRASAHIIADLKTLEHPPKVIVLSSKPGVEDWILGAGADLFVSKGESPEKLLIALRQMQLALEDPAINQVDKADFDKTGQ